MIPIKPVIDALMPAAQLDSFGGCYLMTMAAFMALIVMVGRVEIARIRDGRAPRRGRA